LLLLQKINGAWASAGSPGRLTLADEGRDAFVGILFQVRHDVAGAGAGIGQPYLALAVKHRLAITDRGQTLVGQGTVAAGSGAASRRRHSLP
jgi:hypothetical protein